MTRIALYPLTQRSAHESCRLRALLVDGLVGLVLNDPDPAPERVKFLTQAMQGLSVGVARYTWAREPRRAEIIRSLACLAVSVATYCRSQDEGGDGAVDARNMAIMRRNNWHAAMKPVFGIMDDLNEVRPRNDAQRIGAGRH